MRLTLATAVVAAGFLCAAADAAETELVGTQTVWRVWSAMGPKVSKGGDGQVVLPGHSSKSPRIYSPKTASLTELPPAGWNGLDFDDSPWGRHGEDLFEIAGGFGNWAVWQGNQCPAVVCLRTRFGVSDPGKATDLKVPLEYLGGAVVYVNGVEAGRGHMPEGAIDLYALAADYPIEAYVTDDGQSPLPVVLAGMQPEPKWASRYQARVRRMTVGVPANVLVKGTNVLAVELHRSPFCGPMGGREAWGHLGIRAATMTSAGGAGVIGYADALKGTRVWSAQELEQIADKPVPRSRLPRGWGRGVLNARGQGITGITAGNPLDPVVPVRILVPRNGIGSGLAVLSDPDGLRGVSASVRDFAGPGGAVLPAKAAQVRFAAQDADLHWCDTLLEKAPESTKTLPVWLAVNAPKDQAPGWYVSELSLEAGGKKFRAPVQVFVTGYAVPDAKDFRSLVGVMHSPEAAAKIAGAAPWSDAHFAVMARSLELAGQLGNDILYVPVMIGTHMGHRTGLIRWTKTEKGLQPDFTAFQKYLDLYMKYCAAPRAIILYVWSADTVKEVADAYEGRAIPTRTFAPRRPLEVTRWDPATGTNNPVSAPTFLDDGGEAFWKPMLDGVRAIVLKRGWSDRAIVVGTGGDIRPGQKTGEILRNWAPYARWDIYSHFSADPLVGGKGSFFHKNDPVLPGSAPGKMIAIGNLEVGVKEHPDRGGEVGLQKLDFLDVPLWRGYFDDRSPPMSFRTLPMLNGRLARLGLDFWPGDTAYGTPIWGCYPIRLLARGVAGPVPTVRLQMMREGFQEFEPRLTIMEAISKLPPEGQKPYQALLDDFMRRCNVCDAALSQALLNFNLPAYVAQTYHAAEELTGLKTDAKWDQPPK